MLDTGRRAVRLVALDGSGLGTADVAALAERTARPAAPDPKALAHAEESWDTARRLAATGRVYGRSTGVGANRTEDVATADAEHGLRLLRSHAGAIGDPLPAREVRAMLVVRANQLLAGGAGLHPAVITALLERPGRAVRIPSSTNSARSAPATSPPSRRPGWPSPVNTPGPARRAAARLPPSPSTATTPSR